jgi:hypothetical protein
MRNRVKHCIRTPAAAHVALTLKRPASETLRNSRNVAAYSNAEECRYN